MQEVGEAGDLVAARRALAIREKQLGPDHPDTAISLGNLANLLEAQGDLAAARPLHERALAIREKRLGPDHPDTAASLSNLARLLRAQGDLAAARTLYERALAIYEKQLGPDHPDTATSLNNLTRLLEAQGGLGDSIAAHTSTIVNLEAVRDARENKNSLVVQNNNSGYTDNNLSSETAIIEKSRMRDALKFINRLADLVPDEGRRSSFRDDVLRLFKKAADISTPDESTTETTIRRLKWGNNRKPDENVAHFAVRAYAREIADGTFDKSLIRRDDKTLYQRLFRDRAWAEFEALIQSQALTKSQRRQTLQVKKMQAAGLEPEEARRAVEVMKRPQMAGKNAGRGMRKASRFG